MSRAHSLVKLSAQLCRLLLVTVHTSKSLDCMLSSSCEHMSICQYISHCLCDGVVNTAAFIWESPFTSEFISANCCLIQSAEMTAWAVNVVPPSSSFLRSSACHSQHNRVAGLYRILSPFCHSLPNNIRWGHQPQSALHHPLALSMV